MFNPYIIILGLFIGAGIITTAWGWRIIARGRATLLWPRTEGLIERAEPKSAADDLLPDIRFSYVVNGTSYLQAIGFSGDVSPSPELSQSYLRKYPAGAKVQVSYDPTRPQHSTLEPGPGKGDWGVFVFGVLISVFGVIFLLFGG